MLESVAQLFSVRQNTGGDTLSNESLYSGTGVWGKM